MYFEKQPMTPEACHQTVNRLRELGLHLYDNGIFTKPQNDRNALAVEAEWDTLMTASKLIPLMVLKTSRKGLVGSYGLKHVVERVMSAGYLSNGQLILVMLILGYTMMVPHGHGPNCSFNCQYVKSDYMGHQRTLSAEERF